MDNKDEERLLGLADIAWEEVSQANVRFVARTMGTGNQAEAMLAWMAGLERMCETMNRLLAMLVLGEGDLREGAAKAGIVTPPGLEQQAKDDVMHARRMMELE